MMNKIKDMRNTIKILSFCILITSIYSCKKYETDFRNFLGDKEVVYTGAVTDVVNSAGNQRVGLKWKTSSDPSITKYVVYWNNKLDSQVVNVPAVKQDSISTIISGLDEYVYSFTIHSFDAKGNKSIPKEINNVKIYGSIYQSSLQNRAFDFENPFPSYKDGSATLKFLKPDTINIGTLIKYENRAGVTVEKTLKRTDSLIELTDYKLGSQILYRSSYIPQQKAIDVFNVNDFSVFPAHTYEDVLCNKSLFKEVSLANDVGTLGDCPVSKLWDGSVGPQGYPNIFHSTGDKDLPIVFTFDMGRVYSNLSTMEETGRNCCHNPDQFEVWGIADIAGAATTLPANNSGWKDEAIAKGWTLLADIVRTDDGSSAMKFKLKDNPPPVRYIRIRVKHNANGDNRQTNISELTFWNYQYVKK